MKKTGHNKSFTDKLQAGLDLSFKRLVKSKQLANGYLVFSENGKIVKVKAKDIKVK